MPPKAKARNKGAQPQPGRTLLGFFAVLIALTGVLFLPGVDATKPRLGLDLAGGQQVTLIPVGVCEEGVEGCDTTVGGDQLDSAVDIIRQRVNGLGVTEAEVQTQGSNIVVSVPGATGDEGLETIAQTAVVRFREVITSAGPFPTAESPPITEGLLPPLPLDTYDENGTLEPSAAVQAAFQQLDCTDINNRAGGVNLPADATIVACERNGEEKYILGPQAIAGERISDAEAGIGNTNTYQVNLEFDGEGTGLFRDITTKLFNNGGRFAIVLDDVVQSAPTVNQPITAGLAQITGRFTLEEAQALAQVLKFGQLPVAFEPGEILQVSATVGEDQLEKGIIAGAIGLALVVVYSLLFYRALGLVSIASLIAAGAATYVSVAMLGEAIGFRLVLAGVIGLIVAIGITADSFVVYFERIRDEIRLGRPPRVAVEKAWPPARRTILSADAIALLAAVVLYFLSLGNVQNFAFTLGLTTIIDVLMVMFFTKPLTSFIMRFSFFRDGHPMSGLNADTVGDRSRRPGLRSRTAEPVGGEA